MTKEKAPSGNGAESGIGLRKANLIVTYRGPQINSTNPEIVQKTRLVAAMPRGYLVARKSERKLARTYFSLCQKKRRTFIQVIPHRVNADIIIDRTYGPQLSPAAKDALMAVIASYAAGSAVRWAGDNWVRKIPLKKAHELAGWIANFDRLQGA